MKFRKKPVVIEAVQYTGTKESLEEARSFVSIDDFCYIENVDELYISTLEGHLRVSPNDWIIKGVKGEFYPCKPDIFEMTHLEVNEEKPLLAKGKCGGVDFEAPMYNHPGIIINEDSPEFPIGIGLMDSNFEVKAVVRMDIFQANQFGETFAIRFNQALEIYKAG